MSESLRSMILGGSALYVIGIITLFLTLTRRVKEPAPGLAPRVFTLYLLAVACQCWDEGIL